jgi:hypothetical protein
MLNIWDDRLFAAPVAGQRVSDGRERVKPGLRSGTDVIP